MIPSVARLLQAYAEHARRLGWDTLPLIELLDGLEGTRSEALRLAATSGDTSAAFFYAAARRSAWLGEDFMEVMTDVAHAQPGALSRATVRELRVKAREIAGGVVTFGALRAWLAQRPER
jgi:hypothetical protein